MIDQFQGHWYEMWSTQEHRWKSSHDFRDCDPISGTCEVHFTNYLTQTNNAITESGVSDTKQQNWGQLYVNITSDSLFNSYNTLILRES